MFPGPQLSSALLTPRVVCSNRKYWLWRLAFFSRPAWRGFLDTRRTCRCPSNVVLCSGPPHLGYGERLASLSWGWARQEVALDGGVTQRLLYSGVRMLDLQRQFVGDLVFLDRQGHPPLACWTYPCYSRISQSNCWLFDKNYLTTLSLCNAAWRNSSEWGWLLKCFLPSWVRPGNRLW